MIGVVARVWIPLQRLVWPLTFVLSRRRECPATGHCGGAGFSSALLLLVCGPDCDIGESLDVTNAGIPLAQHCSL